MRKLLAIFIAAIAMHANAIDNDGIAMHQQADNAFPAIANGVPAAIVVSGDDQKGISIAVKNLAEDFGRVCGTDAAIYGSLDAAPQGMPTIVVGSIDNKLIQGLAKDGKIDISPLKGKTEQYLMAVSDKNIIIAGSDRRGTIYGVYELSEQLGVSPWYWWADAPVAKHANVYIADGTYTAGEPAVRYRGIFLNDEAPCLTGWVAETFGTRYGGKDFYAKVFELILRLRGNYMWPAMWMWAFYADDPENSALADEMGVVMGTSHHEPMARNHQEWARRGGADGPWDYARNKEVIDKFFREGIERSKNNEDIITIGMRGDGDAPMGGEEGHDDEYVSRDKENLKLLENVIKNQRRIIKEVTGKPADKRQQLWALYKEVQKFYEMGLQVPDDVIILLSDDNWGDVRRLPNDKERQRKGGWGLYYHVDYVGAPRNTKWLNVTPIQNMWEQLTLAYEYGVDKLWVLNVGDLKPMEYPIDLFMDMAWNPTKYTAETLMEHPRDFFSQILGAEYADEAARLLNLYSKYAGRVTPEMLDSDTYNLATGEWKQVRDQWVELEMEALRLNDRLPAEARDAFYEIVLFPTQAFGNLYDMYYSVAMNRALHAAGNPDCNMWAEKAEKAFARDKELCAQYNNELAGGKWKHMMDQKHIGYRTWNDDFPADILPTVYRMADAKGANVFVADGTPWHIAIDAEHYNSANNAAESEWTIIPYMGRTLSGVTLMPRKPATNGATLTYKMQVPADADSVEIRVITKSTLPFANAEGHKYSVAIGKHEAVVNFNGNLNENPENCYTIYYPTVARRVVEKMVTLPVERDRDGMTSITLSPLDPGIVFEKIIINAPGQYVETYLYHPESPRNFELWTLNFELQTTKN